MPEGADLEDVLYQRGMHPLRSNAHPDPFYVPGMPRSVPSTAQPAPSTAQPRVLPNVDDHRVDQESDVEVDSTSSDNTFNSDFHRDDYMREYYETHDDSD